MPGGHDEAAEDGPPTLARVDYQTPQPPPQYTEADKVLPSADAWASAMLGGVLTVVLLLSVRMAAHWLIVGSQLFWPAGLAALGLAGLTGGRRHWHHAMLGAAAGGVMCACMLCQP